MINQSVFGIVLIVGATSVSFAAESKVKGSMTIGRKVYKFRSVKAYRIKSAGKDSIAVIASEKPFEMFRPSMWPPKEPRWINLSAISRPTEVEQIRDVVSHIQVVFDATTGKATSYYGSAQRWASATVFQSSEGWDTQTISVGDKTEVIKQFSDVSGKWTAKIDDHRITGSGRNNPDVDDVKEADRFNFEFDVAVDDLFLEEEQDSKCSPDGDSR